MIEVQQQCVVRAVAPLNLAKERRVAEMSCDSPCMDLEFSLSLSLFFSLSHSLSLFLTRGTRCGVVWCGVVGCGGRVGGR